MTPVLQFMSLETVRSIVSQASLPLVSRETTRNRHITRVKGVSPVNRRAMRKHRLQNPAWALVAALLPATRGWASEGPDTSAIKPGPASATVSPVPSDPGNTDSTSRCARRSPCRDGSAPMPFRRRNSFPASRGPRSPRRDGLQPRRPSRSWPLNRRALNLRQDGANLSLWDQWRLKRCR